MSSFDAKISWYSDPSDCVDLPRSWTLMIFPIDRRRNVPQDSCWGAKFKCFVWETHINWEFFFHLGEWSFPTFCYPRVTISWPSRGPFVDSRYLGDAVKMTLEAFNADDLTRDEYFDQSFGEGGYAKGKGIQDILLLYNLLLRCSVYSHFTRSYGRAQRCFVWTPEASYPLRMRVAIKCWALTCQCSTKKQEPFNLPACFDERFLGYIIYIYICVVHVVGSQNVRCAKERRRNSTSQNKRPCALGTWQPFLV